MIPYSPVTPPLSPYPICTLHSSLCLYEGAHPFKLSHPTAPASPLCRGIKSSQDQTPSLLLLSRKAILCYISIWSHESLQVYFLVGGLVSRKTEWSGQHMLFLFGSRTHKIKNGKNIEMSSQCQEILDHN